MLRRGTRWRLHVLPILSPPCPGRRSPLALARLAGRLRSDAGGGKQPRTDQELPRRAIRAGLHGVDQPAYAGRAQPLVH
ncbi:hypothetical protein BW892_30135, partial [Bacillus cereus]